jgi:hypothetical protein
MSRPALLGCLALVAGCASFDPANEEVFEPPPVYQEWYDEVRQCSQLTADFAAIVWIRADLDVPGARKGRTIWIDRDYLDQRHVVAHESLHYLLDGDAKHRRQEWRWCFPHVADPQAPT